MGKLSSNQAFDPIAAATDVSCLSFATKGLARLSHRKTLGFGTFTRYDYDSIAGEGVDVCESGYKHTPSTLIAG